MTKRVIRSTAKEVVEEIIRWCQKNAFEYKETFEYTLELDTTKGKRRKIRCLDLRKHYKDMDPRVASDDIHKKCQRHIKRVFKKKGIEIITEAKLHPSIKSRLSIDFLVPDDDTAIELSLSNLSNEIDTDIFKALSYEFWNILGNRLQFVIVAPFRGKGATGNPLQLWRQQGKSIFRNLPTPEKTIPPQYLLYPFGDRTGNPSYPDYPFEEWC